FLQNQRIRNSKIEAPTNAIMKLLVISRILEPGSKKQAFENRTRYFDFEKENRFSLIDIYRSLSHFATLEKDIQLLIHDRITKQYDRQLELIYYDVTNYYFEIDTEDDLRKKGVCKSHTPNPIVQLGMAMDSEGLPISYEVFAGNESEKLHLRPTVLELKEKYADSKLIAVADAAQNTGNNIYYLDKGKQGYVFSQSIRSGSAEFKEYVVTEAGYVWQGDDYKRKSRTVRREISVDFKKSDGSTYKKKVFVDQRQIIFYSTKYAARARAKREAAILKATKIANNPSAYSRATSYGALKYVKNVQMDKETGEIKPAGDIPLLDYDTIREEELYDGYYCIATNLFDENEDRDKFSDEKIIDIYRGLWRIEDSFRVTKSDLETRPIRLSREDRIRAHFLICFIALVIVRLIQKRAGANHSVASLIATMNDISCSHLSENLYLFDFRNVISDELGSAFDLDFTKQLLTRAEIKNILASSTKV
ncbi:MAG: IS1634 family transposase, partial [Defluviitaleaceae bacterium]|nr:IS1634 family transposase [Defluviitaleaceae bacterium]